MLLKLARLRDEAAGTVLLPSNSEEAEARSQGIVSWRLGGGESVPAERRGGATAAATWSGPAGGSGWSA